MFLSAMVQNRNDLVAFILHERTDTNKKSGDKSYITMPVSGHFLQTIESRSCEFMVRRSNETV